MKKRLALSALSLCAALAWDNAAAETRGEATGRFVAAAEKPDAGRASPGPGASGRGPGTQGAGLQTPRAGVGTYGSGTGMYDARRLRSAPAILADLVLLRPFGIALTVVGAGLFIATSPFTAIASVAPPHDAFERTGQALVVAPASFAFMRPLGEYSYQPSGIYPVRP